LLDRAEVLAAARRHGVSLDRSSCRGAWSRCAAARRKRCRTGSHVGVYKDALYAPTPDCAPV
jgi:hypothetical protein